MLDIKYIREHADEVRQAARNKGMEVDIDSLLELDQKRREILPRLEELRAQKNAASKEIPHLEGTEKDSVLEHMKEVSKKTDQLEKELKEITPKIESLLLVIPNPPRPDVHIGEDESGNAILRKVGDIPSFSFQPKDHVELGEPLKAIEIERAAKTSGARFNYLQADAVRLQFALINYVFSALCDSEWISRIAERVSREASSIDPAVPVDGQTLAQTPFVPILPPVLITDESMNAMGYLQHGGDQETYHLKEDKLYLVGTSEQSVGPYFKGEILPEESLPVRFVAYSPCFRREAGAAGKDTRGILRVHQFDKIEMFSFTTPETSDLEHLFLLTVEEELTKGLGLAYQVSKMCTGDLGIPAARKYDIETWMPSQNKYRETHSTSTCTDFQARRLNTRLRRKNGKVEFLHTLNGTAFAMGRIIIAIFENYQQEDGSVRIPEALQKYFPGRDTLVPGMLP